MNENAAAFHGTNILGQIRETWLGTFDASTTDRLPFVLLFANIDCSVQITCPNISLIFIQQIFESQQIPQKVIRPEWLS